jgi:hypothetical protein
MSRRNSEEGAALRNAYCAACQQIVIGMRVIIAWPWPGGRAGVRCSGVRTLGNERA